MVEPQGLFEKNSPELGMTPMTTEQSKPQLVVKNLCKQFGNDPVLKGISLTAHRGDVMAVIGSSGSGKSTLLRCINLLETPDAGEIYVGGELLQIVTGRDGKPRPSDRRQVDRIRTKLGMVFQQFNLWSHMTILQNVIESPVHVLKIPRKVAAERGRSYLEKVGLADKMDAYPAHLSGGQQQRAAIARALAMEPEVLLFDEPTSALDPELVGEVLQVMQKLATEGRTMIIVTHEMGFAREVSNQIVFIHEGIVEEQGKPRDVFERPSSVRCRQFLERYTKNSEPTTARREK